MARKRTKAEFIAQHRATIDEANRRMAELREAKEFTPAFMILKDKWTKNARVVRFNKKMSYDDLEVSLAEAKRFINAKSSTVQGMEDIRVARETRLGDIVRDYGAEGLTANRSDFFRALGSIQYQRSQGTIDSNIVIAYINRQIEDGKTAAGVKGQITRIMREISEKGLNYQDANKYIREKWDI